MEFDELKAIWKQQEVSESKYLSKEQLLVLLNNRMISFDEKIKKRDRREIGVAVLLSLICFALLFILESLWFKMGCVTIILACVFISFKLLTARSKKDGRKLNPEISFKEHLLNELQKVKTQKKLLQSVTWWYLAPLFLGYFFFVMGFNFYWFIIAAFILFGLILHIYIWKINQDAVSEYIDPIITDIEDAIKFINSTENER